MNDLIDRQAAIVRACKQIRDDYLAFDVKEAIKNIPSAIVQCKDCKHYEIWQLNADYTADKRYKPSVCTIGAYSVFRTPDWFCADGERRADDEN